MRKITLTKKKYPKIPYLRIKHRKNGKTHFYYEAPGSNGKLLPLGEDFVEAVQYVTKQIGFFDNPDKVYTLELAYQSYLTSPHYTNLAESTKKGYLDAWEHLSLIFAPAPLDQIKTVYLQRYLISEDNKKRPVRANKDITFFSVIFNHARRIGLTDVANPATGVKKNSEKPRDRYITDAELELFLSDAIPNLANDVLFLYLSGLRSGDAFKVKKSNVWEILTTDKTGAKISFDAGPRLKELIESLDHVKDTVMYHGRNRFYVHFYRQLKKHNIQPFTVHDIRAKALSDIYTVYGEDEAQKMGTHKDKEMLRVYIRNRIGQKVKTF